MAGQRGGGVILGCALRATRLAADGTTPAGADGMIVTNQLVEMVWSDEVQKGVEISQDTACGDYAFTPYQAPDRAKWLNLQLTLATPDYELEEMMTDATLIATSGNTRGIADPPLGLQSVGNGVSLEIWAVRLEAGVQAATDPWVWHVFPKTRNWRKGQRKISNGAEVPVFTGQGLENVNWGNGPTNNWTGPTGSSARSHMQMESPTTPPTVVVGFQSIPAQV